jgi:hemolysin activation/secretion protein
MQVRGLDEPDNLLLPPVPPPSKAIDSSQLRVHVKEILIHGNTVLDHRVLAGVSQGYVGRVLDTADLEDLRSRLARLYIQAGYVNTQVRLPDQDLNHGVLQVQVEEGRLERVEITGEDHYRESYLESRLQGLEGEPLNAYVLERRLRDLEQEPGLRMLRARLIPGTKASEAILEVEVVESRRFGAALDFGNELNPLIGEMAGHVSASVLNPLGVGDRALAIFGLSEGLRDILIRYEAPLSRWGTQLGLDFRYTEAAIVDDDLAGFDVDSHYWMGAIDLGQTVWSDRNSTLVFGVRAEWRQSRSTVGGIPFAFSDAATPDGEVRDSVLRIYQEWTTRSPNQALALRSTWSVGLDILGATSGAKDTAEFVAWLGQAQWRWRLSESGVELGFRGSVQLALDPLLPFERYSVGGYYSVRGYRENLMVRDNGYALGVELSLPLKADPSGRSVFRAGPFADFGRSWSHDRGGLGGDADLASIGVNAMWSPRDWLRIDFSYGAQLLDVVPVGNEGLQDHGISFRVFARWP